MVAALASSLLLSVVTVALVGQTALGRWLWLRLRRAPHAQVLPSTTTPDLTTGYRVP